MRKEIPILRSLDPYHQRIGYLGILSKVASRGLDTSNSLRSRLKNLLFEKIYPEDPRFNKLMKHIGPSRRKILNEKYRDKRSESGDDLTAIFRKPSEKTEWFYLSELWICDDRMPSPIGILSEKKVDRLIDLGRWTGILLPTFELSDTGYVIRLLLEEIESRRSTPAAFNYLIPSLRSSLPLMYMRIMLAAEALWPFLVLELVTQFDSGIQSATRGESSLLNKSVDKMIATVGNKADIDNVLQMKELMEFKISIEKKGSTAENYLRPRMEILTDLGLVSRERDSSKKTSFFSWLVTDKTCRLAEEWKHLAVPSPDISGYLERKFFGSMARIYNIQHRESDRFEEHLLWFSRAYMRIRRELGFTPGSSVATLACMLAYEQGIIIEISDMFDTLYESPKTKWSEYLHYSGGSRFDRDFMIRVDKEIIPALETELKNNNN